MFNFWIFLRRRSFTLKKLPWSLIECLVFNRIIYMCQNETKTKKTHENQTNPLNMNRQDTMEIRDDIILLLLFLQVIQISTRL